MIQEITMMCENNKQEIKTIQTVRQNRYFFQRIIINNEYKNYDWNNEMFQKPLFAL